MAASRIVSSSIFVIWCVSLVARAQGPCQEQLGHHHHTNQSLEFSMVGTRNQTGHWITQFLLNKASPRMENNWKVDLKHTVAEYGGIYSFQIHGVLAVAPPKPMDYELIPGIGYYKLHLKGKKSFLEASAACTREGGHLAIINSEEESNAIKAVYARNPQDGSAYAYVGFYDRTKKRDFATIYGQPLGETGFLKWNANEPSNPNAFCGIVHPSGLLGVAQCDEKLSFFCEYDYSWSEL